MDESLVEILKTKTLELWARLARRVVDDAHARPQLQRHAHTVTRDLSGALSALSAPWGLWAPRVRAWLWSTYEREAGVAHGELHVDQLEGAHHPHPLAKREQRARPLVGDVKVVHPAAGDEERLERGQVGHEHLQGMVGRG